jgi:hypothetical protein
MLSRNSTFSVHALVFVVAFLGTAATASAHAPYEYLERVIHDESGRELRLFRSYVDGIFFIDPVKLVIRDADDRTVGETDYGRDVAVVCPPRSSCLVFRYANVAPILPTDTWRLENGHLQRTRSAGTTALGIVAPLWTHAGGYFTAFMFLFVPAAMAWALWRVAGERGRSAIAIAVVVVGVPYLGVWLYVVVLLSYLSIPWTFVTSLPSLDAK